jgi:hypothetical protein
LERRGERVDRGMEEKGNKEVNETGGGAGGEERERRKGNSELREREEKAGIERKSGVSPV